MLLYWILIYYAGQIKKGHAFLIQRYLAQRAQRVIGEFCAVHFGQCVCVCGLMETLHVYWLNGNLSYNSHSWPPDSRHMLNICCVLESTLSSFCEYQ